MIWDQIIKSLDDTIKLANANSIKASQVVYIIKAILDYVLPVASQPKLTKLSQSTIII